jgi:outer membrane protein TolC
LVIQFFIWLPAIWPAKSIASSGGLSLTPLDKPQVTKLSLEDIINRALEANRTLADSRDQVENSWLSVVGAEAEFELRFVPKADVGMAGVSKEGTSDFFGVGISLEKRFTTGTDISLGPNIGKVDDNYDAGIEASLSQPLLRGFNREFNLSAVDSAEFGARSARRTFYLTRVNTVISSVIAAYEVIRWRELVRLNEESAKRLRSHAEAAKAKEKLGLATSIDTYRAGIQLKDAEDNLATAREAYRDALDNLKVLLALPMAVDVTVEAPLSYTLVRTTEQEAVKLALKNRVELDQAADGVKETKRRSRVAKHNIWPDLDLVMSYSRFGREDSLARVVAFDRHVWGVSLAASTDLERIEEKTAYDQSLISVKSARRAESVLNDEVIREVKREIRNLRRQEQRIKIQEEQIRQSKGKLELAQVKFRWGLANNFDVIDSETSLRRAETNLLSVVIDYIVGSYRLRSVMGTLVERPDRF